jgi:hypothetical protein
VKFIRVTEATALRALAQLGLLSCLLAGCDALIGIQDLSKPTNTGGSGGQGTQCTVPADCPDTGDPCIVRACANNQCELREVPDGPVASDPVGDCKQQACAAGLLVETPDATDLLVDGNPCTLDACSPDGPLPPTNTAKGEACEGTAGVCDGDGACVECLPLGNQCTGVSVCIMNECVSASCNNGTKDPMETDVDCGGSCPACADGKDCEEGNDCESLVCESGGGGSMTCQKPTCDDSKKNGLETAKDCGGNCPACEDGKGCLKDSDCLSLQCTDCSGSGCVCSAPSCTDGVENGQEIDVDCGPGQDCVGTCETGRACDQPEWCFSFNCVDNICLAPSCDDEILNGNEQNTDCGGDCDPCI